MRHDVPVSARVVKVGLPVVVESPRKDVPVSVVNVPDEELQRRDDDAELHASLNDEASVGLFLLSVLLRLGHSWDH